LFGRARPGGGGFMRIGAALCGPASTRSVTHRAVAAPCFAANKFQRMLGGNEANSTSKSSLSFLLKE
jgi:hypothetical protein